jgi:nitroimidazol reductase NimA-like FMN-containing flavoprotein (pyridoxamine 5'-phosphate oxidase superfamily)
VQSFSVTERTRLDRMRERGSHDRDVITSILDEALICHVGILDNGHPVVIPMLFARDGDRLYLHGSPASRTLRALERGDDVSLAVTLVDGIVLARSPFHSSMNYRSVVIFGPARKVADPKEHLHALRVLTERITPGRWDDCRRPHRRELRSTLVLAVELNEASAKIRRGPPQDDEEDYDLPIWAGIIPLETVRGVPVPDPRLKGGITLPDYLES